MRLAQTLRQSLDRDPTSVERVGEIFEVTNQPVSLETAVAEDVELGALIADSTTPTPADIVVAQLSRAGAPDRMGRPYALAGIKDRARTARLYPRTVPTIVAYAPGR